MIELTDSISVASGALKVSSILIDTHSLDKHTNNISKVLKDNISETKKIISNFSDNEDKKDTKELMDKAKYLRKVGATLLHQIRVSNIKLGKTYLAYIDLTIAQAKIN